MSLNTFSDRPAGVRRLARHSNARTGTAGPAPRPVTREELERDLVTLPNKALRHAACEVVRQAAHTSTRAATSMYRLLYVLERLQVSLAWCDALRAATLLAGLPEDESARHGEARSSLSREWRACTVELEELCRHTPPGSVAGRADALRTRIMDAAARLLERLFCEERLLYPPLLAELSPRVLHERAVEAIGKLDEVNALGRRQLVEYLVRALRGTELPAREGLLFR